MKEKLLADVVERVDDVVVVVNEVVVLVMLVVLVVEPAAGPGEV